MYTEIRINSCQLFSAKLWPLLEDWVCPTGRIQIMTKVLLNAEGELEEDLNESNSLIIFLCIKAIFSDSKEEQLCDRACCPVYDQLWDNEAGNQEKCSSLYTGRLDICERV